MAGDLNKWTTVDLQEWKRFVRKISGRWHPRFKRTAFHNPNAI